MVELFAALALFAAVALTALLGYSVARPRFTFWPPPRRDSWQFRVFFGLFRLYCGAVIALALADWGSLGWDHWARLVPGLPLMLGGAWITVRGYLTLGLDKTYGASGDLEIRGLYAYSRNPQYVASVAATIGLGLVANSALGLAGAALLFWLYFLFALTEERWLSRDHGETFDAYAAEVPRFLDRRSFVRAREELVARL